jgi:hypothetical protein
LKQLKQEAPSVIRQYGRGYKRVTLFEHLPNTLGLEVQTSKRFKRGVIKFMNFLTILKDFYSTKRD